MPRSCRAEFRRKVLDLIEAGHPIAEVAEQLGVTDQTPDLVERAKSRTIQRTWSLLVSASGRILGTHTTLALGRCL